MENTTSPVMTLKQLKQFNDSAVDRFDRGEISMLEYWNARMFAILSIQKGEFLAEPENEEENEY